MARGLVKVLVWLLMLTVAAAGTMGKEVPVPTGNVVLRITGTIALTNNEKAFEFDLDMIKALPYVAYKVTDPWLGEQLYGGVELRSLLEYVGIPKYATRVVVIAKDKKEFPISVRDAMYYPIIIAYVANDQPIKASLGGPLKLVFPYSLYPEIQELYPSEQWAWWVVEIRVEY